MTQQPDEPPQANVPPPASSERWFRRVRLRRWIILLIVLLVVVSPALYRQYRINQVPLIPEPFDVAEFLEAHRVSDDENAMVEYREAIELLVRKPEWDPVLTFTPEETSPDPFRIKWENAPQIVKEAVAANEAAVEKWLLGTHKPKYRNVPLEELTLESELPGLIELQLIMKIALWKQCQLEDCGQFDESWNIITGGFHTAVQMMNEGSMTEGMMGRQTHRQFSNHLIRWSENPELENSDLRMALKDVQKIQGLILPFSETLKTEYLMYRHPVVTLRRIFYPRSSDYGYGPLQKKIEDWMNGPGTDLYFGITGEYEYIARLRDHIFANRIAHADDPRRVRESSKLFSRSLVFFADESPSGPELPSSRIQQLADQTLDLSKYENSYSFIFNAKDWDEAGWAAGELILSLQLYYRDEGEFPKELQELVPKYLEKLPENPFADEPENTLLYRQESDHVVLWGQGEYEQAHSDAGPVYQSHRVKLDSSSCFWTVYPPGTRPLLYRPLPEEADRQGKADQSDEGK